MYVNICQYTKKKYPRVWMTKDGDLVVVRPSYSSFKYRKNGSPVQTAYVLYWETNAYGIPPECKKLFTDLGEL